MTKKELVEKFEQIRYYYGSETPLGELRYNIEKAFTPEQKDGEFKKTLNKYFNDIYKLQSWNQECQKKQQR